MVLLAAAVYANSLGNGFARDDVRIVEERELVRQGEAAGAFRTSWWPRFEIPGAGLYRPVPLAGLALQWRLFGGDPAGFHAVSLLLHAAVSLGVFLLLGVYLPVAAAGAAAALFAVHPVHVEAVANVVGQAELLAALLALACAGAYLRSGRLRPGAARAGVWVAVAGLFGLALLSKENAVSLPGLLLLLGAADAAVDGKGEGAGTWRRIGERLRGELPLFALLAAVFGGYLVLRLRVLGTIRGEVVAPSLLGLTDLERVYTSLALWPEYARLLLFPVDLAADYAPGVVLPARSPDFGVLLGVAILAVLAVLVVRGAGRRPVTALGAGWIIASLLPVSNLFFPTGLLLGERILYLPSVGLALVVGDAFWATVRRPDGIRRFALPLVLVLVVLLGFRTVLRNPVWKSSGSVLASLAEDHPRSHVAVRARAVRAFNDGRLEEADRLFTEALRLLPWHYRTVVEAAQVRAVRGRWREAEALFDRATSLYPRSPEAYRLHALRLLAEERWPEARRVALRGLARSEGAERELWAVVAESWEGEGRSGAAARARRAASDPAHSESGSPGAGLGGPPAENARSRLAFLEVGG